MSRHTHVAPPSADERWRDVDAQMRRMGGRPEALIEVLHVVQDRFGFLAPEAMAHVAATLGVPLSRVWGVATFYSLFTLRPHGEHVCVVCTGTACYINGAERIVEAVGRDLGINPGQTTTDGRLSLVAGHCFGVCGLAPAAAIDGVMHGRLDPGAAVSTLKTL